ncbi:zinc finger protein 420-like isoform X1 [Topomyia yanbarensis]|uniref:zinc finger protein 420-like isoform X1 n=1 Tax=Topomyia yanbarensis TaxID=2498891 RepID=UPI00273B5795|nr:zinc finger protein 420-like isoform X1 [Topomyia yanbarensis]XP_058818256.1 zinc finger protein 420-like isoform X1 [Topomyia yanbarensis]
MDLVCCIPFCRNTKPGADPNVGFHPFPLDPQLRKVWMEFVSVDASKFRWRGKYICSEHFLHSELIEENEVKKLLEGAVPMIFAPEGDDEDDVFEREDVMVTNDSTSYTAPSCTETNFNTIDQEIELRTLFCRICLRKRSELLPFSSKLHDATLTEIIFTITGLTIQTDILVPTKICTSCVAKLDLAFSVRIELIHNDKKLKNLLRAHQLENHYKYYDKNSFEANSENENYLDSLMMTVKKDMSVRPININFINPAPSGRVIKVVDFADVKKELVDPMKLDMQPTVTEETFEEEHLVEEHGLDSISDTMSEKETTAEPIHVPQVKKEDSLVEHENTIDFFEQQDSEDEENGPKKKKFVFSWKELYTPKAAPKPKRNIEHKPKPVLIPHTCYICESSYNDADELDTHLEVHVDIVPFTCKECNTDEYPQEFKSLYGLNKHLQTHLYPYKCNYCPIRCINGDSFAQHIESHEGALGDGFTCDFCGRHFTNKKSLSTHLSKHRAMAEGTFTCEYCSKKFNCNPLLKRHLRIHTGEKPFECKKCGKRFNHEANFQNHKRRHTGERAHHCTECGKSFVCGTTLRYHMANHFPGDPRFRNQARSQKSNLTDNSTKNARTNRETTENREYICDFPNCDFVSKVYRVYFYHKMMHQKRFQCEFCEKRFPFRSSLTRHTMIMHENKELLKTHRCTYCSKMFDCRQKLITHIDAHENNRRHKCRFCEKSFVQKNNCTSHEKIHTGERPHACRFCPAAFISSSGRNKHEKTHLEAHMNENVPKVSLIENLEDQIEHCVDVQQDEQTGDMVEYTL